MWVVNLIVERVDFLFLKDRFSWTCTLHIESASRACLVANASSTLRKILNEMRDSEIPFNLIFNFTKNGRLRNGSKWEAETIAS